MDDNPTVSVIIPTFNRSQELRRAIDSVRSQTFMDFELIIVDDCSNDDTISVVNSYADSRINLIRHTFNKGEGAARNTGIKKSRGEYVAFLDSDDEWLPEKLEKQVYLIQSKCENVGVIYTHSMIHRIGEAPKKYLKPNFNGNVYKNMLKGYVVLPSTTLIKRHCFETNLHDETLPNFQDWDLWIRIAKENEFICLPEILCNYYVGASNQATKNINSRLDGLEIFLNKWGGEISSVFEASELDRIRDRITSGLYSLVHEKIVQNDKKRAWAILFTLVFRKNRKSFGTQEIKSITYSTLSLVIGLRWLNFLVSLIKRKKYVSDQQ